MAFPQDVSTILSDLSRIPYENLTKIVAFKQHPILDDALDTPEKLYNKSIELGAGGTCFSLTYFLRDQLHQKGYQTKLVMGDKYHMKNIHCALLFQWEGSDYLLDPGYMIYQPLMLPSQGMQVFHDLAPNAVSLQDHPGEKVWKMYTGRAQNLKFRFDFRQIPATESEFLQFWKDTFYFNMMEYPVLNCVQDNIQYYLQKRTFMTRTVHDSKILTISRSQFEGIALNRFGIAPEIIHEALAIILKKRSQLFLPES